MAVATALPGIAAIAALAFTYVAVNQTKTQVDITAQGQITDRLNNAIQNLGADKIDQRLGGVYALQRIMEDSARDQPSVVQILSAYVRVHGAIPKSLPEQGGQGGADVIAAVGVLAQRSTEKDGFSKIDIRRTYLAAVELDSARFAQANLMEAVVDRATLSDASFVDANLEKLHAAQSNLARADLRRVNASGAYLVGANLTWADLRGVNFDGANLSRAKLGNADLQDANLTGANLCDADLTTVKGVTAAKLVTAELRISTRLPDSLKRDPRLLARIAENERANAGKSDGFLTC
ncbi:pentapeptide repeat-containing protein [Streptomyces sp. NPDC049555]|uniref:pentapeptide repeat-containing protein n=1 Tax=Streptomyces sp. NPDC049555 TaxID=3154930 RepID=UPI003442CA5B